MVRENAAKAFYIVVDVEASGLVPGRHSLLSIGACAPFTREEFYVELKPATKCFDSQAMKVNGFSFEGFGKNGKHPRQAMLEFEGWIQKISKGRKPVFVAFPATFDWPYVSHYFYKYLDRNPFEKRLASGKLDVRVLDLKSFFAGKYGLTIQETRTKRLFSVFKPQTPHTHNALDDAKGYAECMEKMLRVRE